MTNKKIQANNGKLLLGDALSVDHATGRIGIGTASPGSNKVAISAVSATAQLAFGRTSTNQGHGVIGATATSAFELYTGGTSTDAVLAGNALMSVTHAGAVTLGPNTNTPYASYHTLNKSLFADTPNSATDTYGGVAFGANSYQGTGGWQPTRLTGLTGGRISFLPRTSDSTSTVTIRTNLTSHDAITSDVEVLGITAAGAVTLGPGGGNVAITASGYFVMPRTDSATIVSNTITVDRTYLRVTSTSTISNGTVLPAGTMLILSVSGSVTLTIQNNTGAATGRFFTANAGNAVLSSTVDRIVFLSDGANWVEISRSSI